MKIIKSIKHPSLVLSYLSQNLRLYRVKRTIKNDKVYFEYKGVLYPEFLNKGNAASFILEKAKRHCQGKGIDVGAGQWPFEEATPIDYGKSQNAYNLDSLKDGSLDFVFSSHCLEHLERWQEALLLWIKKLRVGGTLFLYLPHKSMELWHPNAPWVGKGHKWIPSYEVINPFLEANGMDIIEFEPEQDKYWSFHIASRKIR